MKTLQRFISIGSLIVFLGFALHAQQYSLQVIQKFPESNAGKNNQVKFADVNGDGKKDMIASYIGPGKVGQVIGIWLNHGTKFSDSVDCTINLGYGNKQCWFNVGDLNGDGMADIVIMSHYAGDNPPRIVYGRATWPLSITTPDLTCQYPVDPDFQTMPQYTSVVIGDFNGDGYNDFAYPEQGTQISLGEYGGRMVMYFGGKAMTGKPDLVFHYPGDTQGYIMSTSPADTVFLRWFSPFIAKGDFNGDGYEDIFTSGYYSYTTGSLKSPVTGKMTSMVNTGAGVIFLGGPDLDTIPDVIMVPPDDFIQYTTATDFMYAGYWVFNAGDINQDGVDEFSLPSWYWGVNFVYKGIKGMTQVPSMYQTVVLRDPQFYYTKNRYNSLGYSDQNGASLVGIGDVNGDSIPDLGTSTNYYGTGPDSIGVKLFFCSKNMAGAIDPSFTTYDYSQIQESNMDFDGDGKADLVMNDLDGYLCLVKLVIPTSVKDDLKNTLPKDFVLNQNYPNPFNPSTTINYYVPRASHVKLSVYNMLGQLVKTLVDENQSVGTKDIKFQADQLSSGIYFYRLETEGKTLSKSMTLLK